MTDYNGAYLTYADKVEASIYNRAKSRSTKKVTVKSGQVLKGGTFLQSDADGKVIAHTGLSESAVVKFAALTNGQTLILAGLTWTAGASGTTAAQLATAWKNIAASTGYAALSGVTGGGTFTAGTLTSWSTSAYDSDSVVFTSTGGLSNVTDLAATGTGTAPSIAKVDGATSFPKIAGLLVNDVDATSADVDSSAYTEISLYASAIVWAVDPNQDTITKADGSTVAVTAYNTGTLRETAAATALLQQKFVENTEFEPLGFYKVGEIY